MVWSSPQSLPTVSLHSYSQPSSLSCLHRPHLRLCSLHLHLLPTASPQLQLPSLLLQLRHPSLAPSFIQLMQLPVSSPVLTPPPMPCPFEHPLYHCTTDDPAHPLLLFSLCSALSLRVGWPSGLGQSRRKQCQNTVLTTEYNADKTWFMSVVHILYCLSCTPSPHFQMFLHSPIPALVLTHIGLLPCILYQQVYQLISKSFAHFWALVFSQ